MQTIVINYADHRFRRRQRMNANSAAREGGVGQCIRYQPKDLEASFVQSNKFLLGMERGAGLWLWKPHIILDAMARVEVGDIIIYCDSGAIVTGSLTPLIEACGALKEGVLGFSVGYEFLERKWTKRDAFTLMGCDSKEYWDTPQLRAGTMLFAKCNASLDFVSEWMDLVRQVRLVSDMPSLCDEPEFDDFQSHRHDQSLFSLLYKKRGYASYETLTGRHVDDVIRRNRSPEPSVFRLLQSCLVPR